jgi:(+)-abscisic acid 8'-hydroxylase
LNETIRRLIHKRRENNDYGRGLLGALLRARGDRIYKLTDSQIIDNLIGVIFAAHDTTASVLTWILKYLHDNVNVNLLEAVTVNKLILSFFVRILIPLLFLILIIIFL